MVLRIKFVLPISTESTVLVRSGYSFVVVEVKVSKYNKTLNVRSLGKPISFVFPGVLMFPETKSREGNIRTLGKTKLSVSLGIRHYVYIKKSLK